MGLGVGTYILGLGYGIDEGPRAVVSLGSLPDQISGQALQG